MHKYDIHLVKDFEHLLHGTWPKTTITLKLAKQMMKISKTKLKLIKTWHLLIQKIGQSS